MAKVSGPLHSDQASGTIAKTIVFSHRMGQNVVRSWAKPANRMTFKQGDNRTILGGVGRAASAVKPLSDYAVMMTDLNKISMGQTKQSQLVRSIIALYLPTRASIDTLYTEFQAHSAHSDFQDAALGIGLSDFQTAYGEATNPITAGEQLYLIAKIAIAWGFTGSPYTVEFSTWTDTEIALLVAALAAPTV